MRTVIFTILSLLALALGAVEKPVVHRPDLDKIKAETTNENSKYYYPKLLDAFMKNDTVMTNEDFQYFYYGTLFQEDYDPYRPAYDEEKLKEIEPLYYKSTHTRQEREDMQHYAKAAIEDNPLDLQQLKNLIFVYEQNKKVNLAKIWKNKLNHLLLTIASSGTGQDTDNAWIVVFPRHEFDFLNISGIKVENTQFQEPYYEAVKVARKKEADPDTYYFNLQPILEQYYLKHPSETND